MIRGIVTADLPMIRIRAEGLAAGYYPEMIPDVGLEHSLLQELTNSTQHYARAVGKIEDPEAVLIARTGGNLWAVHKHATVLLWYSRKPGAGVQLLRDFRDWVKVQKRMVLAGFLDDFGMDARIEALLRRTGFIKRGGAWVHFPGGAKK